MKIIRVQNIDNRLLIQNKLENKVNIKDNMAVTNPVGFAYQDFSINFRGRTPENFYQQEFNVKYMPQRMKDYLNADYETRKHIPPEQIMAESFKFLEIVESIEEAKEIYPEFENLHEASMKGRKGILLDIETAKRHSNEPLFADGSDHLGVYLLKKIYLEGKTLKEINKDFYEKDMNPKYKKDITQPITYGTTSAYGIQYPKTDFWNSFIATRDEYKKFFVTLPKQSKQELSEDLNKELEKNKSKEVDKETKSRKRTGKKYGMKDYQKNLLKEDIKKAKNDAGAIEKAIRKRFTKDDPEASFIVKYLSPIMTIAADFVHLSEKEKFFAETENIGSKKKEQFFSRFWKAHPGLADDYSTAIIDTIVRFEETYEEGGLIPINNLYETITDSTENQKAIDYVNEQFIKLLDEAQGIGPNRIKKYEAHEQAQKEWEEHLAWRYGEIKPETPAVEEKTVVGIQDTMKELEKISAENNANVYHLRGCNGEDIVITANLDEVFRDKITVDLKGLPSKFINFVINKCLQHPTLTENVKLSFAINRMEHLLDDDRIIDEETRNEIINNIIKEHQAKCFAANVACIDVLAPLSNNPHQLYKVILGESEDMVVAHEYASVVDKHGKEPEIKKALNERYERNQQPLSAAEINKITLAVIDYIRNFDFSFTKTNESVLKGTKEAEITKVLQDQVFNKERYKALGHFVTDVIRKIVPSSPYARTVLEKTGNKKVDFAKKEAVLSSIIMDLAGVIESQAKKKL